MHHHTTQESSNTNTSLSCNNTRLYVKLFIFEILTLWSPPAVAKRKPLGCVSTEKIWSPACLNHVGFSTIIFADAVFFSASIKPAHAQPPAWAGLRYCRARGRLACEDHTGAQMENTERQENNLGKNEERRKTQKEERRKNEEGVEGCAYFTRME